MPRKKKEEVFVTEAPAKKKPGRKPRAAAAPTEKPARKPRAPRKKAVVPHFVIQNSADNGITYEAVVEKVKEAVQGIDVTSIDIYVKAEEGKAYYVVNGEVSRAVELF